MLLPIALRKESEKKAALVSEREREREKNCNKSCIALISMYIMIVDLSSVKKTSRQNGIRNFNVAQCTLSLRSAVRNMSVLAWAT
jgi:hypothetical protein